VYEVRLAPRAERNLRRIREGDPRGYRRLVEAIGALAMNPRPEGTSKLRGFQPPAWRLRVGEYRIVYEILEREVLVVVINVAPRAEVYR
jgi:mRNA interferase RelE/StbE